MNRTLFAILFLTGFWFAIAAQKPSFEAIPPSRAVAGEQFNVTFRLTNGDGNNLSISEINGCRLLYGPSKRTSQSYQIVNGRSSSFSREEYTYIFKAEQPGEYTIPAAKINVNGQTIKSRPVKFTVLSPQDANRPASQRPTSIDDFDTQTADRPVDASDVFVRIILSKTNVFEQEALECTIKLYTTYNINQFIPTRQPAFEGFLVQELDIQPALNAQETLNGRNYLTAVLKKCILFPQKPGNLTINSGNYDVTITQIENIRMNGVMTIRQPRQRNIKVTSNSASVHVKPLPEPRPAGFSGAVGSFTVNSRLVGSSFRTNDAASLIFTISGTGNIKYLKEPVIDFPSEFELYTPNGEIDASVVGNNVSGTMTVDYTFVPQSVGDFTIGETRFVYFNPETAEYKTLSTPAYHLKVAKGVASSGASDREDIASKNTDIRHIIASTSLGNDRGKVVGQWWYWLLYALVALTLVLVILANKRHIRLAADVQGQRLAKAGKTARKRLALADKFRKANDPDHFYEEAHKALMGYLGDRFSISASQLSRQTIKEKMAEKEIPALLIERTEELLDRCEMARYTPDSSASQAIDSVYSAISDVINNLERLKK